MSFYESLNVSLSCLTLFWRRFGVVWLCFDVVVAFHRDSKVWVELLVGEMIQWYVNNDGTCRIKNFLNFFLFSKNFLSCPSLLPSSPPPVRWIAKESWLSNLSERGLCLHFIEILPCERPFTNLYESATQRQQAMIAWNKKQQKDGYSISRIISVTRWQNYVSKFVHLHQWKFAH